VDAPFAAYLGELCGGDGSASYSMPRSKLVART